MTLTAEEKKIAASLGVEALILFGSRAQGLARENSDVDVGVLLHNPHVLKDRAQVNALYGVLYTDVLSPLAGRVVQRFCDIDIVFLQDEMVNLQLKYHVSKYGIPLYERDTRAFVDFKEDIMNRYADFAPLRRMFEKAIFARI